MIAGIVGATCDITLNAPADNFYTQDTTPDFNFTTVGSNATYDCTLYLGGVKNGDGSASNNTATVITANTTQAYNEGEDWYIYCQQSTNDFNCTSEIRNIVIGKTRYEAMNSLINFIGDIINLIPDVITITIYGGLLAVVGFMLLYLKDKINL